MTAQVKLKELFYDVETAPLPVYVWRLGDQSVRHNQLIRDENGKITFVKIICISYAWNDGGAPKTLVWDKNHDSAAMIKKFDALIAQADVVIGKNSDRFDNKHINTHRLLNDGAAIPDWTKHTDDIEKQMRKHFNLPSYSLDYFADLLGVGLKSKMEWDDWIDIVERDDPKKLKKMIKYCEQDVRITRKVFNKIKTHVTLKLNPNVLSQGEQVCVHCQSPRITKSGTRYYNKSLYQKFHCNAHHGYAGKALIKKNGLGIIQ